MVLLLPLIVSPDQAAAAASVTTAAAATVAPPFRIVATAMTAMVIRASRNLNVLLLLLPRQLALNACRRARLGRRRASSGGHSRTHEADDEHRTEHQLTHAAPQCAPKAYSPSLTHLNGAQSWLSS